jgi:hypothetical protein
LLGLPVYWYGIIIVSGIALGAWIVSRLAWQRWREAFLTAVPSPLHTLPLTDFPSQAKLARQNVHTLGDLLLLWGSDPRSLALTNDERSELAAFLAAHPAIEPAWLADAPWRQWTPDLVWNGIIICLVLGLIGARLYHVMTPSPSMAALGIESPATTSAIRSCCLTCATAGWAFMADWPVGRWGCSTLPGASGCRCCPGPIWPWWAWRLARRLAAGATL